jgi:probable HAF family extracellular repeat protein
MIASRWTPMDGLVRLGRLPAFGDLSFAAGISSEGRVVVGHSAAGTSSEAFLWTADGGMVSLGDLPGGPHASRAINISPDGTTVVGVADEVNNWPTLTGQAFRWTESDGMVGLGYTQAHHDLSIAYAASPGGSVVVGLSMKNLSDGEAFVWTSGSGMTALGDLPGHDNYSVGVDVTPDGETVVGVCSPAAGYEAFRWTQATGMIPLGDLPGGEHYSYATGVTADGSVLVGAADWDGAGFARAFIWDASNGMRDLKVVLESDYGLDLDGWSLLYANDITADGSAIVGVGVNPSGDTEAWMVRLRPAGCPADFNGDGGVDTRDVLAFLNAWTSGCP